jgi:hypothetical protein
VTWAAEYYNNKELTGTATAKRNDPDPIAFDWGQGSPWPGTITADTFSVRWTRTVEFAEGTYAFFVMVDDGCKLWVDDQLLIDGWREGIARPFNSSIALTAGSHVVKLEMYENQGDAAIILVWKLAQSLTPTPTPTAPPASG